MPLKVKIFHIYIYYLRYKHLYNMTLNLDVGFLLSVSMFSITALDFSTVNNWNSHYNGEMKVYYIVGHDPSVAKR